jgi:hypothetical protein
MENTALVNQPEELPTASDGLSEKSRAIRTLLVLKRIREHIWPSGYRFRFKVDLIQYTTNISMK